MHPTLQRLILSVRPRLGRFGRNAEAVAAVEFAVILPIMLIFYLGTAEITQAVRANAKVASVADTVGNLVTRLKTIDDTSLANIFAISTAILRPFPTTNLTLLVTAVRIDDKGKGTVHWSKANKGATLQAGVAYAIPAELQAFPNSYVVISTATYTYRPTLRYIGSAVTTTIEHSNLFRPRKSLEVTPK